MKNTDSIVKKSKEKSQLREKEVLDVIYKMKREGRAITFYSVQRASHASKSYLHKNQRIYDAICNEKKTISSPRSVDSKTVMITALNQRVRELEKENTELKKVNGNSYKEKYQKEHEKSLELQKQLKTAYKYKN